MPYKDPERQRKAKRESARRVRASDAQERSDRVIAESATGTVRVLPDPPERDELVRLLGVQARGGSVRAIELLLKMDESETKADVPKSVFDELATRRRAAGGE